MRIAGIALALAFILLSAGGGGEMANSSTERVRESLSDHLAIQPSNFPFSWFPTRDRFTTLENEPFLVLVSVDCDTGSPSDAVIELLEPTPSFVQLSPICFREGSATALIAVAPGEGDAGKHTVKIRAIPCRGPGGLITLTIKVKKGV